MGKKNKGATLIIVIFAMMLLAVLGWTLVIMQSSDLEATVRQMDSERAFYLAEAGAQHGYRNLIDNPSWRDATPTTYYTLGKGDYLIKCEDGTGADAGYIVMTTTGYVPNHTNYRATRIIKSRVTSFPWTEAIDAVHILDWSRFWLQKLTTYVYGDLRAANWEGDGDTTMNECAFLTGDYNIPPLAMPLPLSGYNRLVGTVVLPDIDMWYYKEKAAGVSHYISAPYVYLADYVTGGATPGMRLVTNNATLTPIYNSPNFNNATDAHGYFLNSSSRYVCVVSDSNNTTARFRVINVTTPSSPVLTGSLLTNISDARGVFVLRDQNDAASYAYVADGTSRNMRIVNISTPSSPSVYKTGSIGGSGTAYGVFAKGDYATTNIYIYVASGSAGLKIFRWNGGSGDPTVIGTCATTDARGVYVRAGYAYVADGASGLRIIDVSNPASPTLRITCATGGSAYNVYLRGNYAYVASGTAGLKVVDVSNLPNLGNLPTVGTPGYPDYTGQVVATYTSGTGSEAKDVWISSVFDNTTHDMFSYAYVAYGMDGLRVINITTPTSPTFVSVYDTTNANGVFLAGDKLFSGNYNNNKVWFTAGNIYIKGGNMNHTSLVSTGDIELLGTTSLSMKAHVDMSAHENFPCLATRDGSILGSGGAALLEFDGLVFSKYGNIDFDYYLDVIDAVCFMGYNIYFTGITYVDYNDKYIGDPPAGFTSSATQKDWREL